MRTALLAMTAIFTLGGASAAAAHSLYSPEVQKGEFEAEARVERLVGGEEDGETETRLEAGYGFTDRLNLAVFGEVEDEPGEASEMHAIGVEAIFETGRIETLSLDTGVYLEYEQFLHGEGGKAEAKLLLARQFGPVKGLLNLIAEQPLTDEDGAGAMEFGYAAQATAEVAHDFDLGVMALGGLGTNRDFGGRQAHFVGPVAEWELEHLPFPGELEFQAAYLFALGEADEETDGQVQFTVEWEREF